MTTRTIPIDTIRNKLDYDPLSGVFTWRVSNKGHRKAGDVAGHLTDKGYVSVKVDQQSYAAHRLAWALVNGRSPQGEIDHIDGNPANNAITNLRVASRVQNARNKKGSGVRFDQGRWLARIGLNYKTFYLGRYDTEEEAKAAVNAARLLHSGEFANVSR